MDVLNKIARVRSELSQKAQVFFFCFENISSCAPPLGCYFLCYFVASKPVAEAEVAPTEENAIKPRASVQVEEYAPKDAQEAAAERESKSQAATDKFARWILVGSLLLIGLSHIVQLVAGWTSSPIFSEGATNTLDTIKYVATIVMGYLFGKNALSAKK